MKKFIVENWFKIIIVLIAFLVGFYLLYFLFSVQIQQKQQQLLESSIKCDQNGLRFFEDYKTKNIPYHFLFGEPTYHFSKQLNTCLISINYQGSTHESQGRTIYDISHDEVTDVYSNKTLISTEISERDTQFQQQKQVLMRE
ncbi:MAG TPA: hypothetical protein VMV71_03110 [Candidatus Paceibacterota bacterium]|nr:hypothetical protein [Candidatus Paceibacterota bacterium]